MPGTRSCGPSCRHRTLRRAVGTQSMVCCALLRCARPHERGEADCNYAFDSTEHRTMVLPVTQRLFFYLAAFLVALLPVEATYAANGCAPMAEMNADAGDCSVCMDDERGQCQSYCLALCQTLPAERVSSLEPRDLSSLNFLALLERFPPLPNGGPEPPPPRMLR